MANVSIATVKQGLECCQLRGNQRRCGDCIYGIGLCHEDRLHQDALELLDRLQTELEKARMSVEWIPCSKHLPKNRTDCNVTITNEDTNVVWAARYLINSNGEGGFFLPTSSDESEWPNITSLVTAWFPIPAPYKHEEIEWRP